MFCLVEEKMKTIEYSYVPMQLTLLDVSVNGKKRNLDDVFITINHHNMPSKNFSRMMLMNYISQNDDSISSFELTFGGTSGFRFTK